MAMICLTMLPAMGSIHVDNRPSSPRLPSSGELKSSEPMKVTIKSQQDFEIAIRIIKISRYLENYIRNHMLSKLLSGIFSDFSKFACQDIRYLQSEPNTEITRNQRSKSRIKTSVDVVKALLSSNRAKNLICVDDYLIRAHLCAEQNNVH